MLNVFEAVIPVVAIIGAGYVLKRNFIKDDIFWSALNKLAFFVLLPSLILAAIINSDVLEIAVGPLGQTFFLSHILMFGLLTVGYFLWPGARQQAASYSTFFQTSTRWNFPMAAVFVKEVFGSEAVVVTAVVMLVTLPLLNVVNVAFLLSVLNQSSKMKAAIFGALFRNPIVLACFLGIAVLASGVPVWSPISGILSVLGRAALGVMLLCIGAGMVGTTPFPRPVFLVSACATKLVVMPLLVLTIGVMLGLPPEYLPISVAFAATPTAPNGYLLARQIGGDYELYSSTMVVQTFLVLLSLPLWIYFADWFVN